MRKNQHQKDYSYLEQMLFYAKEVQESLSKVKKYGIPLDDEMVVSALAMQIGQIGEQLGADKLSIECQEKYSDRIPFKAIKGFRNRAYHDYGSMRTRIIIETATVQVPQLIGELESILSTVSKENRKESLGNSD